jgi:hypothetical protein
LPHSQKEAVVASGVRVYFAVGLEQQGNDEGGIRTVTVNRKGDGDGNLERSKLENGAGQRDRART